MDAFGNAHWQQTHEKTSHALMQTTVQLDNSRAMCANLEEQLLQKDTFYTEREKELCELHRSEMQLGMIFKKKRVKYIVYLIYV